MIVGVPGVRVLVGVRVTVGVQVRVGDGVTVSVGVDVGSPVAVAVAVGPGVNVSVGVGVTVGPTLPLRKARYTHAVGVNGPPAATGRNCWPVAKPPSRQIPRKTTPRPILMKPLSVVISSVLSR
jgi:hypothetical protein